VLRHCARKGHLKAQLVGQRERPPPRNRPDPNVHSLHERRLPQVRSRRCPQGARRSRRAADAQANLRIARRTCVLRSVYPRQASPQVAECGVLSDVKTRRRRGWSKAVYYEASYSAVASVGAGGLVMSFTITLWPITLDMVRRLSCAAGTTNPTKRHAQPTSRESHRERVRDGGAGVASRGEGP